VGVFDFEELSSLYAYRYRPYHTISSRYNAPASPNMRPILGPGSAIFDTFAKDWEHRIASHGPSRILVRPPITSMFTEFKSFHNKLAQIVPAVLHQRGRKDLLHQARVAREQEDIAAFRALRLELMQHWYHYMEQQESLRNKMNASLSRMFDADTYSQREQQTPTIGLGQKDAVIFDVT
jgi:hypothetical protein